ncbi:MAG: zinc-ribbon domain-containing protein [Thermoplasmatales archaeon]|nr:zinc-ribbon domain-containing protein [Thermoplasmatales archaeon]
MSGVVVIIIPHYPQIIRWATKGAVRELGKAVAKGKNKEIVKVRCHKCHTLNPENAQFCNNCGTRL